MGRKIQEINSSSMADIAFLLLVFFLVATTMNVDSGINRTLPPLPDPNAEIPAVNKDNVFQILVNSRNDLLINNEIGNIDILEDRLKTFLSPGSKSVRHSLEEKSAYSGTTPLDISGKSEAVQKNYRKYRKASDVLVSIGRNPANFTICGGIISLKNDRGTTYETYILVQNEIALAVNELRDEMSQDLFGESYYDMDEELDAIKLDCLKTLIPMQVSEAEPENIGGVE